MHLYGQVLDNYVTRDTATADARRDRPARQQLSLLRAHARVRDRGVDRLGAAGFAWTPRPD